jgi:hypothetical protein
MATSRAESCRHCGLALSSVFLQGLECPQVRESTALPRVASVTSAEQELPSVREFQAVKPAIASCGYPTHLGRVPPSAGSEWSPDRLLVRGGCGTDRHHGITQAARMPPRHQPP